MRTRSFLFQSTSLALLTAGLAVTALLGPSCSSTDTSTGGSSSSGNGGSGGGASVLPPGAVCTEPTSGTLSVRAQPSTIFLPPCTDAANCPSRKVQIILDPDVCSPHAVAFSSSDANVAAAPAAGSLDLLKSSIEVDVRSAKNAGTATITVDVKDTTGKMVEATAPIQVVVAAPTPPACTGAPNATTPALKGGDTLNGQMGLAGASIGLPPGADKPNTNSFLWSVPPFPATIACASPLKLPGYVNLGPAVTFGPDAKSFPREVPLSIPINPALMPAAARLRHLRVAYSGPAFKAPRTIPVSDPQISQINGQWALSFKAPRLGTYQAVVASDAGTKTHKRRLTHRAVIGISMGGGGTASFGFRHHDRFDVMAPLGGPVDWTWLLSYIEENNLGGFRPIAPGTQLKDIQLASTLCTTDADCKADETCTGYLDVGPTQGKCVLMPKPEQPYEHPQTFNTWWYEYPKAGNGGTFARQDYIQIFRDLALMYGNPNGDNLIPGAENLPPGVPLNDPSQIGDHPAGQCNITIDPLDGPDHDMQQQLADQCPKERCAHTLTLQGFYDDEYNPDGTFPVITVCDGSGQNQALTPYANTWHAGGNDYPLELALAVDYNGNGVRDELEPIIRSGHEPYYDYGTDGVQSSKEPGYAPGVNDDPAGDDYNPQYNPTGTENDRRVEQGEKFDDYGLDGVAGTKQQPATGWAKPGDGYDVGEGDGKFTVSRGIQRFWDRDAHSIIRRMVDPAKVPGGELTDDALSRIDVWTDGGTRDLFNFDVDAQHLAGTLFARGRDTAYFTQFNAFPGQDPKNPNFYPSRVVYDDLQGVIFQRYGHVDPTQVDFDSGSGQHVGTATEILTRLQSALYFIGSRWKEPELHMQLENSVDDPDPDAPDCEVVGACTLTFTSKGGRTGPVGINLPPGYANKKTKNMRFPVIYMLHGYGQSPEDLEAAIALVGNWMNSPLDGGSSRLAKAILVYVDGRCRIGGNGKPECLRGTFFADSVRPDGAQDEQWWLELMDYIDQHYRTMPESTVDWTD